MTGKFQPAKLDVDSSILDSGLKIVDDPEDQISQLFPNSQKNNNPINTLLSAGEAEYQTATVVPKPGICVKTKNAAGNKFFINLCKLAEIPAPPPIEESELTRLIESEDYTNLWRVPMSLGAPRKEADKSGGECWAAEVAVNSAWFDKTMAPSDLFTGFVLTIAMEGLCDKYGEDARLDRDKWTVLKNKKFMGNLAKCPAHRVQIRQNLITETLEKHSHGSSQTIKPSVHSPAKKSIIIEEISGDDKDREPDYIILREPGGILTCEVKLPGINSAMDILLDVGEDRIVVTAVKTKHLLDVFLPVNMDNKLASAKYVIDDHTLYLSVPILS